MSVDPHALAAHASSREELFELPALLGTRLGESWSVESMDDEHMTLSSDGTHVCFSPNILSIWCGWRWRGFVSIPHVRATVRARAHAVAAALDLRRLIWIPDAQVGPDHHEFLALAGLEDFLARTWGPPSDIEAFDPDHVARAELGQVETWYIDVLPPRR